MVTSRSRGRGARGFRDVEGEAIAVATKVSELVRKKDMLEALKVVRLVQVSKPSAIALSNRSFSCFVVVGCLGELVCASQADLKHSAEDGRLLTNVRGRPPCLRVTFFFVRAHPPVCTY